MRNGRSLVIACSIGALALACSSEEATSNGGSSGTEGPRITCESESRDVYVANLQKRGSGGVFEFVLAESTPAPPSRGRNTWTVKILDAGGRPVSGAKIVLAATMPSHGHSSPTVPVVTPAGEMYTVGPISLFMPGLWQVTIDVEAGGVRDSTVFSFCVAG